MPNRIVGINYHNTENTIPDIKVYNNHTPEKNRKKKNTVK